MLPSSPPPPLLYPPTPSSPPPPPSSPPPLLPSLLSLLSTPTPSLPLLSPLSQHSQQQMEDLREQLHVVAAQRDDAFLRLASAQEEAEHSAEALRNLQTVLEQFERGTASQISAFLVTLKPV